MLYKWNNSCFVGIRNYYAPDDFRILRKRSRKMRKKIYWRDPRASPGEQAAHRQPIL